MKFYQSLGRTLLTLAVIALLIVFFSFLGMAMMAVWQEPQPVFDLPTLVQGAGRNALDYFTQIAQGDWGEVVLPQGKTKVGPLVGQALKNSLGLVAIALSLATLLGILAGMLAALAKIQQHTWVVLLFTLIGISAPAFFLAILLQNLGIMYSQWTGKALVSMGGFRWDMEHMLMPVLVLTIRPLAHITRATFISLRDIIQQDYIRTAQSKGLHQRHIIWRHALPNFLVPLLAVVAVSFRLVLGILPIVEFVFAWPGLGLRALEAVRHNQPALFIAVALVMGLTMYLLNSLVDFLNRRLDPRLRANA